MDWITLSAVGAIGFGVGGLTLIIWAAVHRGAQKERACRAQQNEFTAAMGRFGYVQDARNRGEL